MFNDPLLFAAMIAARRPTPFRRLDVAALRRPGPHRTPSGRDELKPALVSQPIG